MSGKNMYCPECVEIIQSGNSSKMALVKNPGGLYHYSGSLNRHRANAHGFTGVKTQFVKIAKEQVGIDLPVHELEVVN